jgi:hypothetical protein
MWQHLGFRFEDRDRVKDKPAETTEQMALWDLCPGIEQFPNSRRGNGNSGKIEDTFSFPRVKSIPIVVFRSGSPLPYPICPQEIDILVTE